MTFLSLTAALAAALASQGMNAEADQRRTREGSFLRADDYRIGRIAHRIASRATQLCPAAQPLTGILFHHIDEYELADRPDMVRQFGLDRGLGILSVIEDSPAARAGFEAGDVILALNGNPLQQEGAPTLRRATPRRLMLETAELQIEQAVVHGPAKLRILRNGRQLELTLEATPACPARIRLARSNQTNAFANGRYVTVTTAVLAFAQSEDELAVIIAHEMAHNILNHPDRLEAEGVPRGLLRGIGANAEKVWRSEAEADQLSIRLLAAGGYDVGAAIPFWRRFYARFDGPQIFRTHPSLRARERIIAEAIAELNLSAQRPELGEGALSNR
jgi:hypothetical protein